MTRPAHTLVVALVLSVTVLSSAVTPAFAAQQGRIDTVGQYFDGLPDRFDADAAARTSAIIQWEITGHGGGAWYAIVNRGHVTVREGVIDGPELTIRVGAADYVNILNGDASGKAIFASGRGQVEGSLRLAMKLEKIFPLDR